MHLLNDILSCLCLNDAAQYNVLEDRLSLDSTHEKKRPQTTESIAADILSTLYSAQANDKHLVQRVQDAVHETGWTENLAAAVLNGLENAFRNETPMGQAMKDAYDKASQVVSDILKFAREHPVFCAVVAVGILVILAPWAIEALGFSSFGPVEGIWVIGVTRYHADMWFGCRNLCCLVAVKIFRLRACELMVLVLPAPWNEVGEICRISNDRRLSQTQPHATCIYSIQFRPRTLCYHLAIMRIADDKLKLYTRPSFFEGLEKSRDTNSSLEL